jgi:hypothetical protein
MDLGVKEEQVDTVNKTYVLPCTIDPVKNGRQDIQKAKAEQATSVPFYVKDLTKLRGSSLPLSHS